MTEGELARMMLAAQECGYVVGTAATAMASMHPRWCRCAYCHAAVAAAYQDVRPSQPLTLMLCLGLVR